MTSQHPRLLRSVALASLLGAAAAPAGADDIEYLAASCAACHALGGDEPAIKVLARQDAARIAEAMAEFASGARDSPLMATVARSLTPEETRALADWFSKQRPARIAQ